MAEGYTAVARSYILYREEHKYLRQAKKIYGIRDDLKLPLNALFVLKKRYLLKDDNQSVVETPGELFQRVAKAISEAELNFPSAQRREEVEENFFQMMTALEVHAQLPHPHERGDGTGAAVSLFCPAGRRFHPRHF